MFLDEPSVTATENALVAAVAAKGTTYLRNAASEPHVQDLAHFLVALGANIEGIGTNTMVVHGTARLGEASYSIQPDHIEVGSLIGLAAVTRSPCASCAPASSICARSGWVLSGSASSARSRATISSCRPSRR